jgi:type IV secretion system protein VirB4
VAEALIGDKINLDDHISDDVILMRDQGVSAMYAVAGVSPDTADEAGLAGWFDTLHNAYPNIAADDIEITIYQCRGDAEPTLYRDGPHTSEFARDLAAAYKENLFRGSLYSNKIFLGITIHGPNAAAQGITKFFADATADPRAGINERMTRLNDICALLQSQLGVFGLKRLGYVKRGHVIFSEIAEAIVLAMTGKWRQIPASTGKLSHAMFSEAIRFRRKRIEFHGAGDPTFAEMYAFKEHPATTWPGMFHGLGMAPYRLTVMQSFRFLSNAAGASLVGRKQNKMVVAGDKAISQVASLSRAADEIISRKWVLGDHSLVVIAFADNARAMNEVGNATWRDLAGCGLVATRMTKALQAAFLSMAPGGGSWRPRPGFVKSTNFVAFAPLYNWPAGEETGRWGGPIVTLRTRAGTPWLFHWHPPATGGNGNTVVTGMPGAGKTTLIAMLISMTSGRARVIALDHKRGWDHLIRRLGGDYDVLGGGRSVFAPLRALSDTPANREHLVDLYRGCIGGTMTEEEGRRLSVGITTLLTLPPADRSVGELRAFFDNTPEGAGVRLEKWIHGNELGWVLDAPVDTVRFGQLSGIDTTALLSNPRARGPAMMHLFYRISSMLKDGTPLLLPIDEGWRALQDEIFAAKIAEQLRTIRSKGGVVVFITQSPGDLIEAGISRVLVEMCPNQIHGHNPRAKREDYVKGLDLTDGQFDAVHGIGPGLGMFLIVQSQNSVVVQLPLHGMTEQVRILSASEADLTAEDMRLAGPVIEGIVEKEIAA